MVKRLRAAASSGTDLATPCAENTTGALPAGASLNSRMKTTPLALSDVDDVAVMHDFVPDIDRRPKALQRRLDDVDRAHHAGAKTARGAEQDAQGRLCRIFRHSASFP